MARKIFVSYKHSDNSVAYFPEYANDKHHGQTARAYVDCLDDIFEGEEIYKGEGNEDLSDFKNEAIKTHLKDKIYDSSVTIVLISPNMKEPFKAERDQWIPWEVSYSLKEVTRSDKTSRANGMLAVVLPDRFGKYDYYIQYYACGCYTLWTNTLFKILSSNMFNRKELLQGTCPHHSPESKFYAYPHSYIESVKWDDFVADVDKLDKYFNDAKDRCESILDYDVTKKIPD